MRNSPNPDPIAHNFFDDFEHSMRDAHPKLWALTLFGPFVLTFVLLSIIWMVAGPEYTKRLIVMAILTLWLFGRFIILGGRDPDVAEVAGSMSSLELFAMVLYLDVAIAMVLAFHLEFLFKLPLIGQKLKALIVDGRFILSRQPWIRRATFLGLVMVVMFPLAATGSVGGSVFGRLLGLSRLATFLGILAGSLIGNGAMVMASGFVGEHLNKDHPVVKFGGVALVVVLILFLESRYRRMRKQFERELPRTFSDSPGRFGEGRGLEDRGV
jgi:uncharacterized membrane protein